MDVIIFCAICVSRSHRSCSFARSSSVSTSTPPGFDGHWVQQRAGVRNRGRTHAEYSTWRSYYRLLVTRFPWWSPPSRTAMPRPAWTKWLTAPFPSVNAILATAFFRCWHWMFMFTAWAAIITTIHQLKIHNMSIQNTLLTVLGTVLGCTYI